MPLGTAVRTLRHRYNRMTRTQFLDVSRLESSGKGARVKDIQQLTERIAYDPTLCLGTDNLPAYILAVHLLELPEKYLKTTQKIPKVFR